MDTDTDTCADLLWSAEPNRWVVEELAALPPGRAVDLGCGEGRDAVWLAEHGWQVTGIDFSAAAIAKARTLAAARGVDVRWVVADLADHPFDEDTAFDLVLVAYLHPPPAQRSALLRRAAQAVAPGGTVLVVGHDLRNLTEGHGGPAEPAVLYAPDAVAADLHGLRIEAAHRVQRPVEVDGTTHIAVDTLVRATRPVGGEPGAAY
jgi:SAM-dependent methyltransferase